MPHPATPAPAGQIEVVVATRELAADMALLTGPLGMRLEMIWPADNPRAAVLSGHGALVRLAALGSPEALGASGPGALALRLDDPAAVAAALGEAGACAQEPEGAAARLTTPGGVTLELRALDEPVRTPDVEHAFVVRRLAERAPWVVGRAGMQYRDLVPGRLGGAMIASHIRIPQGGPVPDMVHYHKVGFQLIFCLAGWVDVVYEDQGPPIRLVEGACFIQPPEIRHRVLEASDGLEVLEIGVPAEHMTVIDHQMTLPTPHHRPERRWQGQRFVHNRPGDTPWRPHRLPGFEARDTTIAEATGGVAGVEVLRPGPGDAVWARHEAEILFALVWKGAMTLEGEGRAPQRLEAGDAFVIPPGMGTRWSDPTPDLRLIEVTLPGRFATELLR